MLSSSLWLAFFIMSFLRWKMAVQVKSNADCKIKVNQPTFLQRHMKRIMWWSTTQPDDALFMFVRTLKLLQAAPTCHSKAPDSKVRQKAHWFPNTWALHWRRSGTPRESWKYQSSESSLSPCELKIPIIRIIIITFWELKIPRSSSYCDQQDVWPPM